MGEGLWFRYDGLRSDTRTFFFLQVMGIVCMICGIVWNEGGIMGLLMAIHGLEFGVVALWLVESELEFQSSLIS